MALDITVDLVGEHRLEGLAVQEDFVVQEGLVDQPVVLGDLHLDLLDLVDSGGLHLALEDLQLALEEDLVLLQEVLLEVVEVLAAQQLMSNNALQ